MTLPRSIQREFSRIDTLIEEGTIQEGYDYCSHPFHYEITAEELERLKRSDWKNLVFVDVGPERGVNGSYSMHSRQIPRNATKSGGRRFITLVLLDELSVVFAGRVYQWPLSTPSRSELAFLVAERWHFLLSLHSQIPSDYPNCQVGESVRVHLKTFRKRRKLSAATGCIQGTCVLSKVCFPCGCDGEYLKNRAVHCVNDLFFPSDSLCLLCILLR